MRTALARCRLRGPGLLPPRHSCLPREGEWESLRDICRDLTSQGNVRSRQFAGREDARRHSLLPRGSRLLLELRLQIRRFCGNAPFGILWWDTSAQLLPIVAATNLPRAVRSASTSLA